MALCVLVRVALRDDVIMGVALWNVTEGVALLDVVV